MIRALVALVALPIAACTQDGCDIDLDCKGDRICDLDLRACVDPPAPDLRPPAATGAQICRAACDANKRCGASTDAQAAMCRATCDAMRDEMERQDAADDARCIDAARIRAQIAACYQLECNRIATCVAGINRTCEPR